MDTTRIAETAQALYASHGSEAELKAAQKAKEAEAAGDRDGATTWQAIRRAVNELRGAPES